MNRNYALGEVDKMLFYSVLSDFMGGNGDRTNGSLLKTVASPYLDGGNSDPVHDLGQFCALYNASVGRGDKYKALYYGFMIQVLSDLTGSKVSIELPSDLF